LSCGVDPAHLGFLLAVEQCDIVLGPDEEQPALHHDCNAGWHHLGNRQHRAAAPPKLKTANRQKSIPAAVPHESESLKAWSRPHMRIRIAINEICHPLGQNFQNQPYEAKIFGPEANRKFFNSIGSLLPFAARYTNGNCGPKASTTQPRPLCITRNWNCGPEAVVSLNEGRISALIKQDL
jgi:hypothetical protein